MFTKVQIILLVIAVESHFIHSNYELKDSNLQNRISNYKRNQINIQNGNIIPKKSSIPNLARFEKNTRRDITNKEMKNYKTEEVQNAKNFSIFRLIGNFFNNVYNAIISLFTGTSSTDNATNSKTDQITEDTTNVNVATIETKLVVNKLSSAQVQATQVRIDITATNKLVATETATSIANKTDKEKEDNEVIPTKDPITTLIQPEPSFVNYTSYTIHGKHDEQSPVTNIFILYPSKKINTTVNNVKPTLNIIYSNRHNNTTIESNPKVSTSTAPTTLVDFIKESTYRMEDLTSEYFRESPIQTETNIDSTVTTESSSTAQLYYINVTTDTPSIDPTIYAKNYINDSIENSLNIKSTDVIMSKNSNVAKEVYSDYDLALQNTIDIDTNITSIKESANAIKSNDYIFHIDNIVSDDIDSTTHSSIEEYPTTPEETIFQNLNVTIESEDTKSVTSNQVIGIEINTTSDPATTTEYFDDKSSTDSDEITKTTKESKNIVKTLQIDSGKEYLNELENDYTNMTTNDLKEILDNNIEHITPVIDLTAIERDVNVTVTQPDGNTTTINAMKTLTTKPEYFNEVEYNDEIPTLVKELEPQTIIYNRNND